MTALIASMLKRDIQERLVFRWSLLLELASTATMLLVFFLIDRYQGHFFGDRLAQAAGQLGTTYFGYVSLGLAVSALAQAGLGGVPGQLYRERANRSLEYLMASPLSIRAWALASGLCNLLHALIQFSVIFGVSAVVLRMRVPRFDFHAAAIVLLLSCVPLWCLSALALSSTLVIRRGNPFHFAIQSAFELLGGVYVPQSVLPAWLARAGEWLPITPAVRAMQSVVYRGAGLAEIAPDLYQLCALTALYLPMALWLLGAADGVARRKGLYCLS